MSMSMGGMSMDMPMGSMSMGPGVPGLFYLQKMYWAVVGAAIAAATVVNLLNHVLARQRLRDTSLTPAKPKSLFFRVYATLTAIAREVAHASLPPFRIRGHTLHLAPLGPVLVVLANLVVVLVFCFYKLDTTDRWSWEDIGYRTGFVAIAQLPLVFLLAGKQNIIGLFTGLGYERLNWFHRWISRTLWLTVTIHMGFWFRDWAQYDYITYQLKNDPLTKRGFAAWCILTFIVIASFAPVRRLSYEIFVVQHIVMFAGFLAAVYLHAPDEVKVWVWIPIGLVIFDRVARFLLLLYSNFSFFHPFRKGRGICAHQASFTPLPGNVTRITIENPVISWEPGQHVFLSCHSIVPLQSHPFTIASIPSDQKLEFFVRAEKGGTRRFFRYASKYHELLGAPQSAGSSSLRTVFVEGPYGKMRPLRQFDSVVLLAGGMGITFTVPLLRDIVEAWKQECLQSSAPSRVSFLTPARLAATKRIRFVWVIKSRTQLGWFETQLQSVLEDAKACQQAQPDFCREVELSVYVTCDEKLEEKPEAAQQTSYAAGQMFKPLSADGSNGEKNVAEKQTEKDAISIRSASDSSNSQPPAAGKSNGCLPGGGCCCTVKIEDESQSPLPKCCNCSGTAAPSPGLTQAKPSSSASSLSTKPNIPIFTGRPHPRTIIRKVLERTEGESAVVVCGPRGLADDVRRSVVSLSDERAVHKGTGAQGIYLHVEQFGW
ncbi:putative metalloreductase [Thermoascus aurantiacus ATCC 26904]